MCMCICTYMCVNDSVMTCRVCTCMCVYAHVYMHVHKCMCLYYVCLYTYECMACLDLPVFTHVNIGKNNLVICNDFANSK